MILISTANLCRPWDTRMWFVMFYIQKAINRVARPLPFCVCVYLWFELLVGPLTHIS